MLNKLRSVFVAVVALACALPALGGEVAVLRNGFTISFERKEVRGQITRLYVRGGFVDVPSSEIDSFEQAPDDPPEAPPQPASAENAPPPQPQPAVAPSSATTPGSSDIDQLVRDASSRYRLDPDFVNSVIKAESNFHVRAVSPKGAQGLMQLMPATAAQLGVSDAFDPKANVEAGTAYLNWLLEQYHDDPIKALAAYNAGAHRVEQYHGVPPYMETRAYVARIVRDYNAKKLAQMKASAAAQAATTPASAAAPAGSSPQKSLKRKKAKSAAPSDAAVPKAQGPA
jgi:hypothetical protein